MPVVPTMRTWTDGYRVRTADFNEQIRDTLEVALDPPQTMVYRTTSTNLPTGTTYIPNPWEATWIDNNTGWSTAFPTRVYINTAGKYLVDSKYQWGTYTTGLRANQIRVNAGGNPNNGTLLEFDAVAPIGGGVATTSRLQIGGWMFAAGDYVELFMYQNSGAGQPTVAGTIGGFLSVRWIGR